MITATPAYLAAYNAHAKQPIYLFEVDGYGRAFSTRPTATPGRSPWIQKIDDHRQAVDVLNASSTLGDLSVTVIDYQRAITGDFAGTVFEGRPCTLKAGFVGLAEADYVTLFSGIVDSVPGDAANTMFTFVCKDRLRLLKQVVYLLGDDGQPCSEDHPRTILGNPIDILISVLQDEAGFAGGDIDLALLTRYRDEQFGGISFSFKITSPPDAKSFIENEILKPLGGVHFADNLGRYTARFMLPLAGTIVAVATLDASNLLKVPEPEQAELINVLSIRFDNDGSDFRSEAVELNQDSIDLYGQQGQQVIESQGMRSGFQGFSLATLLGKSVFNRYAAKNPQLDVEVHWGPPALLELGDFVYVTHALVPDRKTGTLGITNALFQVDEINRKFHSAVVGLKLADASGLKAYGALRIAPDAQVDYTSASGAQKARYIFMSNPIGKQSNGDNAGTLG